MKNLMLSCSLFTVNAILIIWFQIINIIVIFNQIEILII